MKKKTKKNMVVALIVIAVIGIVIYLLKHSVKKGNSEYPQDWPGRELYLP